MMLPGRRCHAVCHAGPTPTPPSLRTGRIGRCSPLDFPLRCSARSGRGTARRAGQQLAVPYAGSPAGSQTTCTAVAKIGALRHEALLQHANRTLIELLTVAQRSAADL